MLDNTLYVTCTGTLTAAALAWCRVLRAFLRAPMRPALLTWPPTWPTSLPKQVAPFFCSLIRNPNLTFQNLLSAEASCLAHSEGSHDSSTTGMASCLASLQGSHLLAASDVGIADWPTHKKQELSWGSLLPGSLVLPTIAEPKRCPLPFMIDPS